MHIQITRVRDVPLPQYETDGAIAFDFTAAETTTIPAHKVGRIPTGLIIQTPIGYGLFVYPRSSTPMKHGLLIPHGAGLIDQDYCGTKDEILLQYQNFTEETVTVEKGTRIGQGVFIPILRPEFVESDTTKELSRSGFGSTGGHSSNTM